MDDFEPDPPLSEKRRRYFAARDKFFAEKKGFRKLDVDSGPKGPQFVMVLLCLFGIALVAFQILGPSLYRQDSDDITDIFPGDDPDPQTRAGIRLDPEPLQSYLIRMEVALFDPPPADSFETITANLSLEIDRLSEYLKTSQEPGHQNLATELESATASAREDGFDLKALVEVQNAWLSLRARSFRSASWFRKPTPSERSPQPTYAMYRDVSDQLLRQVGNGLTEVEDTIQELAGIGSQESDQTTRQDLLARWKGTAEAWRDEVLALKESLPKRPSPTAPGALLDAVHRLDKAFEQSLSRLPADRLPTAEDLTLLEETLTRAQFAVEGFDALDEP